MNVLVTGARGFVGKNLCVALRREPDLQVVEADQDTTLSSLTDGLAAADFVFHLAGVNRPETEDEFQTGNAGFTEQVCRLLGERRQAPPIVFTSSAQAAQDNPYGRSKRGAEEHLAAYAGVTKAPVLAYRLPNVFGRWSRPNYNSVVATFCYNVARGLPIAISDPMRVVEFVHVAAVVESFVANLRTFRQSARFDDLSDKEGGILLRPKVDEVFNVSLGELATLVRSFAESRKTRRIPDFKDRFAFLLYSTYTAFLPEDDLAVLPEIKRDARGWLAELMKSEHAGQIFVSTTHPGVVRGNHYHERKVEKFIVIKGQGLIRFRQLGTDAVIEYPVSDDPIAIVDIPCGTTHSIENTGTADLICLFWANEIFDVSRPDTYAESVKNEDKAQGRHYPRY